MLAQTRDATRPCHAKSVSNEADASKSRKASNCFYGYFGFKGGATA